MSGEYKGISLVTAPDPPEWGIQRLSAGVVVWHAPCRQYRSFHEGEWIGAVLVTMLDHRCPD